MPVDPSLADEDYCYLTTTGRVSGLPREIEIWFGLQGDTLYMLAGGGERSGWVRNAGKEPNVTVRIRATTFRGRARRVEGSEDALARRLLAAKYAPRDNDGLDEWGRTALPIAVDLSAEL